MTAPTPEQAARCDAVAPARPQKARIRCQRRRVGHHQRHATTAAARVVPTTATRRNCRNRSPASSTRPGQKR